MKLSILPLTHPVAVSPSLPHPEPISYSISPCPPSPLPRTLLGLLHGHGGRRRRAGRAHAAHTAGAVLTAIFQGAATLLAFIRTADFLAELWSYVREEARSS